ncbi:hypothetical protein [Sphingomonas mali]|uniref:hypothetical protein n=1 Tax=Sphingomonas mali TaxID=40682 RepID=UPI000829FB4E|nr:hypothetical protein [Sphingomonas mali]
MILFSAIANRIREDRSIKRIFRSIDGEPEEEILRIAATTASVDDKLLLLAMVGKLSIGFDERQSRAAFGEILKIGREERSQIAIYVAAYARYNLAVLGRSWGDAAAAHERARRMRVNSRVRLKFPIPQLPRGTAIRPNVVSVG